MGHFGWLRKYYRETSRNMLVPWMVWGIQGMYIQGFYSKSRNTFKFSNVFWLQRSHTSSDFLRSQLMFSSWSPFPIYIRMLDPIISKFHPEGVIHVNLVSSPKKNPVDFLLLSVKKKTRKSRPSKLSRRNSDSQLGGESDPAHHAAVFFEQPEGGSVGTWPQRMTLGWASVIGWKGVGHGYGGTRVRKGWVRNWWNFPRLIYKEERRGWLQQSLLWRCPFWGGTCCFFILFQLKKASVQWIWFHPPAFLLDVSVGHSSQSL